MAPAPMSPTPSVATFRSSTPSTNTVVATVTVGSAPYGVAITPDGTRVYVSNTLSNNVSVIDTSTNTVMATVAVENGPRPLGNFIGALQQCSTPTPTPTATVTPTPTATPTPIATPTVTPTPTPSSTPTPRPHPTPRRHPTPPPRPTPPRSAPAGSIVSR